MGKYDPWDEFFSALEGDEVRFDLSDLEELSRVKLPPSAYKHPEWWSRASVLREMGGSRMARAASTRPG